MASCHGPSGPYDFDDHWTACGMILSARGLRLHAINMRSESCSDANLSIACLCRREEVCEVTTKILEMEDDGKKVHLESEQISLPGLLHECWNCWCISGVKQDR